MANKSVFVRGLFLSCLSIFLSLVFSEINDVGAQVRLDDPEGFVKVAVKGIRAIKKTGDMIQIQTNPTAPQASLIFSLESDFDAQKNNLFEITIRTGRRIPALFIFWRQAESKYDSFRQYTYRDGEFHTYIIPLYKERSWSGVLSELALVWDAPTDFVEIKKLELRPVLWKDRIRYHWLRFWFPDILNPATVNLIRGPVFLGIPFAAALILVFLALALFFYVIRGADAREKRGTLDTNLPLQRRHRFQPVFWSLMVLWVAYDLREAYDHVQTLKSEFRSYLNTSIYPRYLLELDDLYDFLEFVEKKTSPSTKIGFYSARPLFLKARYFLFPRHVVDKAMDVDFVIVFQDPEVSFRDGKLLERGKVIGEGLKWVGGFGETAYLLEKTHG